ncbi:MAG: hypothetical protein V7634_3674, partial [Bradyrhizobium sp.]
GVYTDTVSRLLLIKETDMRTTVLCASLLFAFLSAATGAAEAQCALPYQLTNGQPADATQVMADYSALSGCIANQAPAGGANAVQYNAGNGTLGGAGPLTNGQLVIGSTGGAPQAQTLSAGSGIVISNGPGNITISTSAGAGSGLYGATMSGRPTAASTGLVNWINQGGSTSTDSAAGLSINAPTAALSGGSTTGLFKPAPSAPYTITALIAATRNSSSYNAVGIGWYDGTNKLHALGYVTNGGGVPFFQVQKWNAPTSYNSTELSSAANGFSQPIWLRIADDGASVSFSFSQDGANFLTLETVAKSSGFLGASGYSNIAFFANPLASQTIATLMSWTVN